MRSIKMALLLMIAFAYSTSQAQTAEALMAHVRNNDLESVRGMLSAHPELVDFPNDEGITPLILAAYMGHEHMVNLMAPLSQNIDHKSTYGNALMAAAVKGELGIASTLLQHGAQANSTDAEGGTALILATTFQNEEMALLLLDSGADPLQKNNKGFSALDYAQMHKNTPLIIKFENHKP